MQTKIFSKKHIFLAIPFLLAGILPSAGFALADTCPNITTVSGTTVTFVGEITDTGGDTTNGWFEYGASGVDYKQVTSQRTVTQPGPYCVTVSNLSTCTTYNYRAVAQNSAGTSYGENKSFTTTCSQVTVDLKANGYEGSLSIPYNSAATLSWTSTNANSCYASVNWSGSRAISGSESTGSLTSSRSYTLTCTGSGGSAQDSVTVNISSATNPTVNKMVRNLSNGTGFVDSVPAAPLDVLTFSINVSAGGSPLDNVVVKETMPSQITWRPNSLKLDGVPVSGDIISGYNMGSLSAYQARTVTFDADITGAVNFVFGDTQLVNSVLVYNSQISSSDTAKVVVTRKAVAGATTIPTGITDNLFVDSFLIPLAIALLLVWLFRSKLIKWEQWLDSKRKGYQEYKSDKVFKLRAKKIRTQEFLKRN